MYTWDYKKFYNYYVNSIEKFTVATYNCKLGIIKIFMFGSSSHNNLALACTIKDYRFTMYGKWTIFVISYIVQVSESDWQQQRH